MRAWDRQLDDGDDDRGQGGDEDRLRYVQCVPIIVIHAQCPLCVSVLSCNPSTGRNIYHISRYLCWFLISPSILYLNPGRQTQANDSIETQKVTSH